MSVKTKKYTEKNSKSGDVFRAVRVTAANFDNVAQWSGGTAISKLVEGDLINQRVLVNKLIAQIGDFVVVKEKSDGIFKAKDYTRKDFFRVKDDVFEATFEAA